MTRVGRVALGVGLVATIATLAVWITTGRNYYTKFEVVERVEVSADPDDPLAGTGFYDDEEPGYETVRRGEFHLGLLPTPQGLLDKHAVSVVSILVPAWAVCLVLLWRFGRRRGRSNSEAGTALFGPGVPKNL